MLLSELPVELRSKIYFHSDSAALLGVWRLRALRPLRLPPRARAAALRGFCARIAEQLSDEALADLLGDDALNAEEALVSAVALPRGLAGHVRGGLLPGRWEGARPRRGPGVRRWQSRRIERDSHDLVGTFFLAGTGGSRVFSALLGGGVVEWDVVEGREVRRLAPRLMACSLTMAAWGQQLALGQINGRVAMFHVGAGVCVQELFAGDDVVRCMASAAGNLLYLSGQGPKRTDGTYRVGRLGRDITIEEAYQEARLTGLNLLAATKAAVGDLSRVEAVVKLLGMVNAEPDFSDHPKVINGCSDLFVDVLGEAGRHARSAVGMGSLPNRMSVEIEAILLIRN